MFAGTFENAQVCEALGKSVAWVAAAQARLDIHDFTRRPRIADPDDQQADVDLAIQERALALGIWHLGADGEVVRCAVEEVVDDTGWVAPARLVRPPREPVAPPVEPAKTFRQVWTQPGPGRPRAPLPTISREEQDRLVTEAIAAGRFTKVPAANARTK